MLSGLSNFRVDTRNYHRTLFAWASEFSPPDHPQWGETQESAAATAFQQILDHPELVRNCLPGALAHLGLARAFLLQGDSA